MSFLLPRRPERSSVRRHLAALLLALLFHAGVVAMVVLNPLGSEQPRPPPRPQAIAMRAISDAEWAKNRGDATPEIPAEPLEVVERKQKDVPGQVVTVAPGNGETPPETDFLAETNNRTDKQTVSRERTLDYKNAMKRRTSATPTTPAEQVPQQEPVASSDRPSGDPQAQADRDRQQMAKLEVPNVERRTQVDLKDTHPDGAGAAVQNREQSREVKGNSENLQLSTGADAISEAARGQAGPARRLKLLPSASLYNELYGAPASDDVGDIEEGDETSLNTREYKHAAFFSNVNKAVAARWKPAQALGRRDPTGQIYGFKERVTRLGITIDGKGRLLRAEVIKSCGIDFLDLEAVQSFERSHPFLPPPEDLLNEDGVLRYAFTFTFTLTPGGSGLQIVRRKY